ncbi:hypothetical protein FD51_GL000775 [Lacticaseibacillus zeae DSM 20178 = KCTC 3804]|uniref:Uncharacterized protein n=2 Tax=Lacticaseibacillus zeae TaxID=57037 RepID=A0A5R8LRP0_LACZE|nr:hypothetical protein FD51_GL000775 [Lacticaseibacillus zeae DSM 20178 = KCTC 3804]OLS11600.1 hypothetical protein AUQ39_00235 [Lacticaseibacillus casei]TLF39931.1 hypothetical protein FEI14_11360 [Lacticaseibacillus zeae]
MLKLIAAISNAPGTIEANELKNKRRKIGFFRWILAFFGKSIAKNSKLPTFKFNWPRALEPIAYCV